MVYMIPTPVAKLPTSEAVSVDETAGNLSKYTGPPVSRTGE